MMFDKIDLDEKEIPFNPKLTETVVEFLRRQRIMAGPEDFPEGTEFECRRCGDCCRWNYYFLDAPQSLIDQLYMVGPRYPHGYWVLILADEVEPLNMYMPTWNPSVDEAKMFHFGGNIPEKHKRFCRRTGRTHGYWVLNDAGKISVYCPSPCEHLTENNLCAIYSHRPEVCREYMCARYPIIKHGIV